MPPVSTKSKLKRKSNHGDLGELGYDNPRARETEQRRKKGQISCAECERLKIKCDKQIPCQSCRRRGCAALCPNGSLSTGQGTRFVFAATEHLHHRLAKMSERNRQLEGALSELQARHSTEPHPLLRPDLLGAPQHDDDLGPPAKASATIEHTPGLVEAVGTLSVSDSGTSRFFGPTAGSHCLLMIDNAHSEDVPDDWFDSAKDSKTPENENFILALPRKPAPSTLTLEKLVTDHLPTEERARYLTKTYVEQASWLFQSVSMDQILLELLPAYYVNGASHVTQRGNNPHRLGLLFLVFAIGASLDLNQEPRNCEAEHYHQFARATICLQSVMEKPCLETIQALHLLSIYNTVSGNDLASKETSVETSWSLVALAAHLAHTLGLHRDVRRWGLSADVTARRRTVFWNLFVADVWNCLEAGRPPTFSLPYIDCQFPGGGSPHDKIHTGSDRQAFSGSWALRFASDCVADVAARTLTPDSPSYSTILELDRKVRNFPVPETVEEFVAAASGTTPMKPADKDIELMESVDRFVMSTSREVVLLYIHRSYFAQAIIENPINPLNSPYTPSFLAAYRASLTILRIVKVQYDLHPKPTARLSPIWTSAFSAAVVFGTIVTRGPRSPVASGAMKELRDACLLFSKASSRNRRAQRALPIITKLMEKAQTALLHAQSDIPDELGQQWRVAENEGDDELAIFTGRMKIFSMKRHTTDGKSSGSALVSQHKQNQVEPVVPPPCSGEELGSTWLQQPGPAASLEQTQEVLTWDRPLYPGASSQSTAPLQTHPHLPTQAPVGTLVLPSCSGEELGSTWFQQSSSAASLEQTQEMSTWDQTLYPDTSSQSTTPLRTPHVPTQAPVEPAVPPSCSGEELGSTRLQQPGSTVGQGKTQEMATWHWTLYSDAPSKSTLTQLSAPLQIPPHMPSETSAHGELAAGSSTSAWPPELPDPCPTAAVSAPRTQAHPQEYHPPYDRYDQHGHCPPTSSAPSTASYCDYPFASAGSHHHQSWPQSHPSTHSRPHSPPHQHHPIQPLPGQYQPTHSDPPQFQPIPLAPPKLAQLGLVTQESGLDQRWVSFMRESGFFDGF